MPITLIIEDGSGLVDANSYISVEFADQYHARNLHGAAWAALDEETKKKAIITASRLLDQQWDWNGWKRTRTQRMQWPRRKVVDPDVEGDSVFLSRIPAYLKDDEIPLPIQRAAAALALVIFEENREAEPAGHGLSNFNLQGVLSVGFDLSTRPQILPEWLSSELTKYGRAIRAISGTVKLTRT